MLRKIAMVGAIAGMTFAIPSHAEELKIGDIINNFAMIAEQADFCGEDEKAELWDERFNTWADGFIEEHLEWVYTAAYESARESNRITFKSVGPGACMSYPDNIKAAEQWYSGMQN